MPLKIEINAAGKFIIVRERKYENDLAFTMFVDATKTSWTSKGFFAQQFASRGKAHKKHWMRLSAAIRFAESRPLRTWRRNERRFFLPRLPK